MTGGGAELAAHVAMVVKYVEMKGPRGFDIVKTESNGAGRPEDAVEMAQLFGAGGRYADRALLIITDPDNTPTAETRRAYAEARRSSPVTTALVVKSLTLRVAVNCVIRAAGTVNKSEKEAMCFSTEEEAVAWLEEQQARA